MRMTGEIPDVVMHTTRLRSKMTAEYLTLSLGTPDAGKTLMPRDDLEEDSVPEEFLASVISAFGKTDKYIAHLKFHLTMSLCVYSAFL